MAPAATLKKKWRFRLAGQSSPSSENPAINKIVSDLGKHPAMVWLQELPSTPKVVLLTVGPALLILFCLYQLLKTASAVHEPLGTPLLVNGGNASTSEQGVASDERRGLALSATSDVADGKAGASSEPEGGEKKDVWGKLGKIWHGKDASRVVKGPNCDGWGTLVEGSEPKVTLPPVRSDKCVVEMLGGGTDKRDKIFGAWPVCMDRLRKDGTLYSIGLGRDISFDHAAVKLGVEVHGFDPTVTQAQIKEVFRLKHKLKKIHRRFHYHPFGLGAADGNVTLFQSHNPIVESKTTVPLKDLNARYRSTSSQVTLLTLSTLMCMLQDEWIDVLKMDVEGSEFDICLSEEFRSRTIPVDQLVISFHPRMVKGGLKKQEDCEKVLEENGFRLVFRSRTSNEILFVRMAPSGAQKESA
eukprot:TRINITY_DN33234_c0_g1_i1.p1 TRINITY_DN33234_c0_g1~~TRINITY_DN33234_c0_g1_i1.p1  ORF type:complete len:413 (-),score=60.60 TRINITY_DN33234_c0_g1_i1:490-1728(-)